VVDPPEDVVAELDLFYLNSAGLNAVLSDGGTTTPPKDIRLSSGADT
jgi:hypothetical protein